MIIKQILFTQIHDKIKLKTGIKIITNIKYIIFMIKYYDNNRIIKRFNRIFRV